jgi:ComF family protein
LGAERERLEADLIMPIPLHESRLRDRGFNQAKLIAKVAARVYDVELDDRSLVRIRQTERRRAGMDSTDRARSVAGAFSVTRPDSIKNASVLIVDDVYTTGSTLCEASRSLLEAGATRVNVFSIARVII